MEMNPVLGLDEGCPLLGEACDLRQTFVLISLVHQSTEQQWLP